MRKAANLHVHLQSAHIILEALGAAMSPASKNSTRHVLVAELIAEETGKIVGAKMHVLAPLIQRLTEHSASKGLQ